MIIAATCICDPKDIVRDDGTHIAVFKQPSFMAEVKGIWSVLSDKRILCLLPAMFVGEMCLALVSSINGVLPFYLNAFSSTPA